MKVRRFESRDALNEALAQTLEHSFEIAGSAVMLSGGKTPQQVYARIAADEPKPARDLHVLYCDERYVPRDSQASNYHSSLSLLNALALPEEQIQRVRTELPIGQAAADYERRLRELLQAGNPVRLGLLGLGTDGHTASLFTAEDLERARDRFVVAIHRPDGLDAISVTPKFLSQIERLIFLVVGANKREILPAFIAADDRLIASRAIANHNSVEVWCDLEAAADV